MYVCMYVCMYVSTYVCNIYIYLYKDIWPPFLGTPGSATWKHCHGYPCSNAPSCVARFARAGTLAHVSCSHTPPALLLQVVRWPQSKVPAPHPANSVTSSRRFGRASEKSYIYIYIQIHIQYSHVCVCAFTLPRCLTYLIIFEPISS